MQAYSWHTLVGSLMKTRILCNLLLRWWRRGRILQLSVWQMWVAVSRIHGYRVLGFRG